MLRSEIINEWIYRQLLGLKLSSGDAGELADKFTKFSIRKAERDNIDPEKVLGILLKDLFL